MTGLLVRSCVSRMVRGMTPLKLPTCKETNFRPHPQKSSCLIFQIRPPPRPQVRPFRSEKGSCGPAVIPPGTTATIASFLTHAPEQMSALLLHNHQPQCIVIGEVRFYAQQPQVQVVAIQVTMPYTLSRTSHKVIKERAPVYDMRGQ